MMRASYLSETAVNIDASVPKPLFLCYLHNIDFQNGLFKTLRSNSGVWTQLI